MGAVHIIDDDNTLRKALTNLFKLEEMPVRSYESAEQFIETVDINFAPACIILDLRMQGMSGIELQKIIKVNCSHWPIIFLTGHGQIHTAVEAMKSGAVEFLEKPVDNDVLISAVQRAISQSEKLAYRAKARSLLTPREKEILDCMEYGTSIKEIATQLDISEKTVEFHRANVTKKVNVKKYKGMQYRQPQ